MWSFREIWVTLCTISAVVFLPLLIFNSIYENYQFTKVEKERKRKEDLEAATKLMKVSEEAKRLEVEKRKKNKQSNRSTHDDETYREPFDDFDHSFLDDHDEDDMYSHMYC